MEIKSEQYVSIMVQAAISLAMKTSLDPELRELRQAITTDKSVLSKSLDNNRRMLSYDHNCDVQKSMEIARQNKQEMTKAWFAFFFIKSRKSLQINSFLILYSKKDNFKFCQKP